MKFGDEVLVKAKLDRIRDYNVEKEVKRIWYRTEFREPKKAKFLGETQLSNGTIETDDNGDEGVNIYYVADERIKGAWVFYDRSPKKVFLSDLELV